MSFIKMHTRETANFIKKSSRLNHHESCSHNSSKLTQFTSQAKVNDLDPCTSCVHTDDVLRFEVQVNDILLVNVPHALQDLLHVAGTGRLCVLKVVIHKAFKELPTCNTGQTNKTVHYSTTLNYCSSGTPRFSRISHMVCSHFKVSTEVIICLFCNSHTKSPTNNHMHHLVST